MDLAAHRKAVHKELTATKHFQCVWQEDFGAQDAGAVEFCRQEVQKADLFIGLVGLRRGWEPDGDNAKRSITEMEHDWAREAGRRRFLWVTPDDLPLAGSLRESDEQHGRQVAFRGRVKGAGERIVSQMGFDSPELLAAKILNHLLVHVLTSDLITQLRPEFARQSGDTVEDHAPAIAAAVERLAEDDDVDLLTLAKDPKGVDLVELETKLRTRAETHEAAGQRERKTSAEYWRHVGALAFLRDTRRALMAYEKAVALDSDEPESWGHLGELQCRLGDLTAAEKTFERQVALGASTGNLKAQAMGQLGLGWIFLDRGDLVADDQE
jgi:tetratricopeptide (TPR) repeat protein